MSDKKLHLEHAEDCVFLGFTGIRNTLDLLLEVGRIFQNIPPDVIIQYKVDGSPNLVFGTHPENGRRFVGTKSVFAKTPKINYTLEDIEKNYKFSSYENLRYVLKTALLHLPRTNQVLSGDVMFTDQSYILNDRDRYTFKPNVIRYKSPLNGFIIPKIGLFVHTVYEGKSLSEMNAHYITKLNFPMNDRAWIGNPVYKNSSKMDNESVMEFYGQLDYCEFLFNKLLCLPKLWEEFIPFLKLFVNHNIKNPTTSSYSFNNTQKFKEFISVRFEKEIAELKTHDAKNKKREYLQTLLNDVGKQYVILEDTFELMEEITYLKTILLGHLPYSIGSFECFFDEPDGTLTPCPPEGLVVMNPITKFACKLVNRTEFSRRNFMEHNQ